MRGALVIFACCSTIVGVLGGPRGREKEEGNAADRMMDLLLSDYRRVVLSGGSDIANFSATRETLYMPLVEKVELSTDGGWVLNASTLHRTTDAKLSAGVNFVTVEVGLGHSLLEIFLEELSVKSTLFDLKGSLKLSLSGDSIYFKVTMYNDNTGYCKVTLENLEIHKFGKLKVDLEPSTLSHFIWNYVIEILYDKLIPYFKTQIESRLTTIMSPYVEELSEIICFELI